MKNVPLFLAFTLCFLGGIAGTVYLVTHEHPWFGFFVLLLTGSLSIKPTGADTSKS